MTASLDQVVRWMLELALALTDISTRPALQQQIASLLANAIPCDDVLWTEINLITSSALVARGVAVEHDQRLSSLLGIHGGAHPAVQSYLPAGDDRRARRLSDLVSLHHWRHSAVYYDAFRSDRAQFQLSLVTSLEGGTGRGWVLTRQVHDFSADDLDVANVVLPLLVSLEQTTVSSMPAIVQAAPDHSSTLTARELEVLQLIASGMTASAIGRLLGVSEATVRKHTDHIYTKLGERDRLTAVLHARRIGLLRE